MEDLMNQLMKQVGLTQPQALRAIRYMIDYLDVRLPNEVGDQVRALIENPSRDERDHLLNEKLANLGEDKPRS